MQLLSRLVRRATRSRSPSRIRRLVERSREAIEAGDPERAHDLVRRALKIDERSYPARRALADVHVRLGDWKSGAGILEDLAAENPDNSDLRRALGNLYERAGHIETAREWFKKTLELDPEDLVALGAMSRFAMQRQQDRAVEEFLACLKKSDRRPYAPLPHALMRARLGDYRGAEKILRETIDAGQTTPDLLSAHAAINYRLGHEGEAMDAAEKAASHSGAEHRLVHTLIDLIGDGGENSKPSKALRDELMSRLPPAAVCERLKSLRETVLARRRQFDATPTADVPTVSMICPIHRPEDVRNAVRQLSRQNWPRLEAIVALHTDAIEPCRISELWPGDMPLTVLPAAGLPTIGAVLNAAISASAGDLIMKFDADDLYFQNYVLDMVLALMAADSDIVIKRSKFRHYQKYGTFFLAHPDWINRPAGFGDFGGGSAFCAKRETFDRVPFHEGISVSEDVVFSRRCISSGFRIYFCEPFNHLLIRRPQESSHSWALDNLLLPFADGNAKLLGTGVNQQLVEV